MSYQGGIHRHPRITWPQHFATRVLPYFAGGSGKWKMPPIFKRRKSLSSGPIPKRQKIVSSGGKAGGKKVVVSTASKRSATPKPVYRSSNRNRARAYPKRRPNNKKRPRKRSNKSGSGPSLSGVDASFSNARYGSGPRVYRGFKSRGLKLSFTSTLPERFRIGLGYQGIGLLPTWQCRNQNAQGGAPQSFTDYLGAGTTFNAPLLKYMQIELQRNLQRTAFSYNATDPANSGTPKGIKSAKFVVHGMTLVHELKSTSIVPIHITLYELVLRNKSALATSTNDTTLIWKDPKTVWEDGLTLLRDATAEDFYQPGQYARDVPGEKPFSSPLFCRMYRVYKTTKLILAPGQTHIHKVSVRPNNMFPLFPFPDTTGFATNHDHLPGIETCTMAVYHGTPVHQQDAISGSRLISTSAASFDCVTKCHVQYQAYDMAAKNYHQFNFLQDNTTVVNPVTVTEDNDTLVKPPNTGDA